MPDQLSLFETEDTFKDADGETRYCTKCNRDLPINLFWIKSYGLSNTYMSNVCRPCDKKQTQIANELKTKYMHLKGSCCEICEKQTEDLVLDHDHSSGIFRGWLCQTCNTSLGKLGDSIEAIEKVYNYLKKSNHKNLS